MFEFPADIFTEPDDVDPDTLKNLGPLAPLAGIWDGRRGLDVHLGGYWLWEPATGMIIQTHTIPRGLVAMATGHAAADVRAFELECVIGSPTNGICSNPFLDHAKRTIEFRIRVDVHDDGSWSHEQDTVLRIRGRDELFHHTDRNRPPKVADLNPNGLMRNRA